MTNGTPLAERIVDVVPLRQFYNIFITGRIPKIFNSKLSTVSSLPSKLTIQEDLSWRTTSIYR